MISNDEVIFIDLDEKAFSYDSSERKKFFFNFKYLDFSKAKTQILPFLVPVWTKAIVKEDLREFESIVKLVIDNIDGISFVKKIALKCDLELNYVIYILYNLILMDCICLVDVFQFSNIYRGNINMRDFAIDNTLKEEFKNFCILNLNYFSKNFLIHKNIFDIYNTNNNLFGDDIKCIDNCLNAIDNAKFFSYFCELSVAQDVNSFIKKVKNFRVFISLFVAFGVYKKILRRVNVYVLEKNKEIKDLKENKDYSNNE